MLQSQMRILQYPKYFCIPSVHDGRIKSLDTCTDLRAWSLDEQDQSNYLLDVIKNDSFQYFGHVSLSKKIFEKFHHKDNESSILEEISLKENVDTNNINVESDDDTFFSLKHSTIRNCFPSLITASLSEECTEDYLSTQSIVENNKRKEQHYSDFSFCDDSSITLTRRETVNNVSSLIKSSKVLPFGETETETKEIGIQVNVPFVEKDVNMINDQTNLKIFKSDCFVVETESSHEKNLCNLMNLQNTDCESFDAIEESVAEHYLTDDDIVNMHENLKGEIKQQLNEVVQLYEQLQEKLFVNHMELSTTKRELEDIKTEKLSLIKENQISTNMFCEIQKQLRKMKQENMQLNVETNSWNHKSPNSENDELTHLSFKNGMSTVKDTQTDECTSNFQMTCLNRKFSSHVTIEDNSIQHIFPIIQQDSNGNTPHESIITQRMTHDIQTRSQISIGDNYTPCRMSSEDDEIVINALDSEQQDIIKVDRAETSECIIESSTILENRSKQIKSTVMIEKCKTQRISGGSKITLKRSLHKINSDVEYNRLSPASSNSISKKEIVIHPEDHSPKSIKQIDRFGKVRKNLALIREGTDITIRHEDPTRAQDVHHRFQRRREHGHLERRETSQRNNMTSIQQLSFMFEIFNCSLTVRLSN